MDGIEWLVDATACAPGVLADRAILEQLFSAIVRDAQLTPIGEAIWQQFPETGGITGVQLLAESHLACHTFPEYGSLCLNLFCCRPRHDWDPEHLLREYVGARQVHVRTCARHYTHDTPLAEATTGHLSERAPGADSA